ncbi:MAG TPA: hypothetical protein VGP83_17255 [Pyrinomonadaceae bacterium]|jgi:hypothetical protein|nr:hypothetical protein [Pyrinomonadaceae bacterium]
MPREQSIEDLIRFIREHSHPVTSDTRLDYIVGSRCAYVEGSEAFACSMCGRTVYLSDGAQMKKLRPEIPVACLECVVREVK